MGRSSARTTSGARSATATPSDVIQSEAKNLPHEGHSERSEESLTRVSFRAKRRISHTGGVLHSNSCDYPNGRGGRLWIDVLGHRRGRGSLPIIYERPPN